MYRESQEPRLAEGRINHEPHEPTGCDIRPDATVGGRPPVGCTSVAIIGCISLCREGASSLRKRNRRGPGRAVTCGSAGACVRSTPDGDRLPDVVKDEIEKMQTEIEKPSEGTKAFETENRHLKGRLRK